MLSRICWLSSNTFKGHLLSLQVKYVLVLSGESASGEGSADTFSEEVTYLYKRCLAKKVYTQLSVMYSAFDSTSDHYSNVVESPAPCLWVDENVPEPHGTTIKAAFQYLC